MMKCHYEVLSIERDAKESEIKTAYRKAALKWHPDKNLDNSEFAKEQFQLVQQAYEVLSDPQERAWYDRHREQILRKSHEKSFKDDSLDVFEYFTSSCFQGYGDDEKGFYSVYRNVFQKIAAEDIEYLDSESDFEEIPLFGDSQSSYEEIVGPFYAYWMSYSTKKSFSWLDPFDILQAPDQRTAKMMEKANKKIRVKARKERNEEVRNLVAFVRKRDKRAQAYAQMLQNRALENRQKQENIRRQKIKEREKELLNAKDQQQEWLKFENMQSELEEIEKSIAAEFGENISGEETDESDLECNSQDEDPISNLYCVACNKVFKTPKAFENHESSKKHRENIEKLKKEMIDEENSSEKSPELSQDEDEEDEPKKKSETRNSRNHKESSLHCTVCNKSFKTSKAFQNHEMSQKHYENLERLNQDDTNSLEEINEDENQIEKDTIPSESDEEKPKSKNRKKKSQVFEEATIDSDDNFDFGLSKKQKKKNQRNQSVINAKKEKPKPKDDVIGDDENPQNPEEPPQREKPSKKDSKKKSKNDIEKSEPIDLAHCCVTCKSNFPSKNKLFDHLKKTGHSIAVEDKTKLTNVSLKTNKKKKS